MESPPFERPTPTAIEGESVPPPRRRNWGAWLTAGGIGLYLLTKLKLLAGVGKLLLPAVQFLKLGKVLTTGGTMFLSMWLYAVAFGWPFGVGLVLLIFVHEMGHVFAAWRLGLPVTAPVFVPFMGAVIFQKEHCKSAWDQAVMGIGGPAMGTLGALACWGMYGLTGNLLFLGLAYVGFFLNLFNLLPVVPLDGGWIVGSISPWLWLTGLAGLIALYGLGVIHNPFILVIVLLSIPHLWHGLRHGGSPPGGAPSTFRQKVTMGVCYLALSGFLFWAMGHTFTLRPSHHTIEQPQEPPVPVPSA
jgi:Zn-dependent protease